MIKTIQVAPMVAAVVAHMPIHQALVQMVLYV
jgi:hypothetical protein